jgi:hypothetical protein
MWEPHKEQPKKYWEEVMLLQCKVMVGIRWVPGPTNKLSMGDQNNNIRMLTKDPMKGRHYHINYDVQQRRGDTVATWRMNLRHNVIKRMVNNARSKCKEKHMAIC